MDMDKGFTTTTYAGREFIVPVTGEDHNLNAALTPVPDDDHAMAYLMQDGNLGVPGGRYGSDTASCAPLALRLAKNMEYHTGEPMTYWSLDSDMSMVVNGSDDVLITLVNSGDGSYDPADFLDDDQKREAVDIIRAAYDDDTAQNCADILGIKLDIEWCVIHLPIMETDRFPRRVVFKGPAQDAEQFFYDYSEREDVDEFYVILEGENGEEWNV